mmetsp:Transcript_24191/g.40057  ORF Transcript_24191/g.40057 Transcript_24191/m.40057 type:complete len:238 (-) Transcript_24191:463-1176(-)
MVVVELDFATNGVVVVVVVVLAGTTGDTTSVGRVVIVLILSWLVVVGVSTLASTMLAVARVAATTTTDFFSSIAIFWSGRIRFVCLPLCVTTDSKTTGGGFSRTGGSRLTAMSPTCALAGIFGCCSILVLLLLPAGVVPTIIGVAARRPTVLQNKPPLVTARMRTIPNDNSTRRVFLLLLVVVFCLATTPPVATNALGYCNCNVWGFLFVSVACCLTATTLLLAAAVRISLACCKTP